MVNRLLSAIGLLRAIPQKVEVAKVERMPYALLSGHPNSDPERVVEVTDYLSPEAREMLSRRFPAARYRAFLGVSPRSYGLDPETPTVVLTYRDGSGEAYYLTPEHMLQGGHIENRSGPGDKREDVWECYALLTLARHMELSPSGKQRLVEQFEHDVQNGYPGSSVEPWYRWPEKPSYQTMWPGKHYRLVNTVVNGLPVQAESPLISEPSPQ